MAKAFRIISKTLSTVMVAAVVLLAVLLAGIRLVGFTPYTVLSGSMEPTYHVGSIIYVSKIEPTALEVNDPITYRMSNGTVVTHRIVEILNEDNPSNLSFRVKGDANQHPDGTPIPAVAVIGKPRFTIPYMGYVSEFVQTKKGLFTVLGGCVAVLIISVIIDTIFPKPKKETVEEQSDITTEND